MRRLIVVLLVLASVACHRRERTVVQRLLSAEDPCAEPDSGFDAGQDVAPETAPDVPPDLPWVASDAALQYSTDNESLPLLLRGTGTRLVTIWRKGVDHSKRPGSIWQQVSLDDGATWAAPSLLFDDPSYDSRPQTGGVTPTGAFVYCFFKSDGLLPAPALGGVWCSRSSDEGETWSTPAVVAPLAMPLGYHYTYGQLVTAPSGIGIVVAKGIYPGVYLYLVLSGDDGVTWTSQVAINQLTWVGVPPTSSTNAAILPTEEAAFAYVGPSTILGFDRNKIGSGATAPNNRPLLLSSTDDGAHWTVRYTGITNHPLDWSTSDAGLAFGSWEYVSPHLISPGIHGPLTVAWFERIATVPTSNRCWLQLASFDPAAALLDPSTVATTWQIAEAPYLSCGYPYAAPVDGGVLLEYWRWRQAGKPENRWYQYLHH